ncbi:MAG: ferrous iron transport protein B [Thermoplasmata archaeon]
MPRRYSSKRAEALKTFRIALAGNANVGKSVLFNELTGLHQKVGNWPGKTVAKAEGKLHFEDYEIAVIDLPGIYSLSSFSIEEIVSRDYIALERPDVVINVVDATSLERNLFLTLQLMELEAPLIVALNQMDLVKKKGWEIDIDALEQELGVPVIPTVATRGEGIHDLLTQSVEVVEEGASRPRIPEYSSELESRIGKLQSVVSKHDTGFPPRWTSIKMLEGDDRILSDMERLDESTVVAVNILSEEIEGRFGDEAQSVIAGERYRIAGDIFGKVARPAKEAGPTLTERIDALTMNRLTGYVIMGLVLLGIFLLIFIVGDLLSGALIDAFAEVESAFYDAFERNPTTEFMWKGFVEGILAGVSIALPYLIPFFLILAFLEGSGYLPRVAFLMDRLMHKIGLHGKAFIPLILGFGCNVPACMGCRIMETERERLISVFVITLVPCAATTVVILGVVGTYLGVLQALGIYIFNFIIIILLGRLAFKALPGEPMGLIMEVPPYRWPSAKTVLLQTWSRLKDFIVVAFPYLIVVSVVIQITFAAGLFDAINNAMSPVTVAWLGLPSVVGVVLIFGILRKELTLIMLVAVVGATNLATVLSPVQMVVFTVIVMLYIPCVATIATMVREIGRRKAAIITFFELSFAILVGGIVFHLLSVLSL